MFSVRNLQINRGLTTGNAQGKFTTIIHTYKDIETTIANILLYFPPFLAQNADEQIIQVGDHMLILGSDTSFFVEILSLDPFTVGTDLFSGASGLTIGAPVVAVDNNGAIITGQILQLEIADTTHSGIVTELPQDFGGAKTFHDNVKIITGADFLMPPNPVEDLIIKTQDAIGGVQIQGNNPANIMAYAFGTPTLGGSFAGLAFSEAAFGMPFNPGLFLALGTFPAVGIDNLGNTIVTLILKVDTIEDLNVGSGTLINGNRIKSNNITLADTDVFWDTENILANTTRFSFDANDYFSYDKTANALDLAIGSTVVTKIDATEGIQTDIGFDRITAGQLDIGLNNATTIFLAKPVSIFGGGTLLTDNIDTATPATPLNVGTTNASVINLNQNTVIANTKTLHTNTLDATVAGALTLGGATATSIILDEDTTVSTGKILKTNTLDATSAAALTLGGSVATLIALDEDTTVTVGKLFKANSVDSASAVPLVLGDTTATAITLDKDTTVTAGQLFKANSVDAATATTLIIGDTTATAITLDKNTTVTSGSVLNTNTLDATTAGTLNIGTTTATAITLAKSTTVTSGQLFKANSVDAATATALIIGDTTATAITLDKDTTVTAGQLFKANSVDAATAVPIVIGDTTATAITLDKNTTVTTGSTLTADSITLLTTGGTPTALNYYEELSFTSTFTLNALTTAAVTIKVIRVGKKVTVQSVTTISTAPQVVTGTNYTANTALATQFRPTVNVMGWARVSDINSKTGMIIVQTNGIIQIFNDPDGTTNFASATGNGANLFTISYTVL